MLYFFHGPREGLKKESKAIRSAFLKKNPDALFLSFDPWSSPSVSVEELALRRGLFQSRSIIELDGLFGAAVFPDEEGVILAMEKSENLFLVLEEAPPKAAYERLKKYAQKEKGAPVQKRERKEFSAFFLADALAARDKKRLWTLFREAIARGYVPEELFGILFWQAKTIILAHKTHSASEAGVKPYPYSKAQLAKKHYTPKEAETVLHDLSLAILSARGGAQSLEHATERVILSL